MDSWDLACVGGKLVEYFLSTFVGGLVYKEVRKGSYRSRAGDRIRTGDVQLGKLAFYR